MSRHKRPDVKRKLRRGPVMDGPELGACCHLFSGGPDESAVRFLDAFKRDAARYGWTDAQRRGAFEDALVCEPRRWFRCGGFRSWKSVEKAFLLRWAFSSAGNGVAFGSSGSSDTDSTSDGAGPVATNYVGDASSDNDDGVVSSDSRVEFSSSDDGIVSMTELFDRVRPNRTFVSRRERVEPQPQGISNLNDFISTLD